MSVLTFPGNPNPTPAPAYRGRLLTVDEVHTLLSGAYSRTWIYRDLEVGRVKLSPGRVRWREYDLLDWINGAA